jgi:hypothetical protein
MRYVWVIFVGIHGVQAWRAKWQASRSHQLFFVGSKGEAAGNQRCQLRRAGDGAYSLSIRVSDRLLPAGGDK